jgi:5-methylcytosine-specific restriction endonuclease McrA
MKVLALASNYEPLGIISWTKAVSLVYSNKVSVIEEYNTVLRSPTTTIKAPAVVLFKRGFFAKNKKNGVKFSRKNVWIRDEGYCQYCKKQISYSSFTLDHIVPKTNGGKTTWENVVTCCHICNQRKANKSLKECGFTLIKLPRKPVRLPYMHDIIDEHDYNPEKDIPELWKFYLER